MVAKKSQVHGWSADPLSLLVAMAHSVLLLLLLLLSAVLKGGVRVAVVMCRRAEAASSVVTCIDNHVPPSSEPWLTSIWAPCN